MWLQILTASFLGILTIAGCRQEYTPEARRPQTERGDWQVVDDDDERQRYVIEARRQIEGVYHAAAELEQVAGRFGVAEAFAPYRQAIAEHLQTAQNRVSLVEQIDEARLDAAVGYLAEAMERLFDAYNDAAEFIQRYIDP